MFMLFADINQRVCANRFKEEKEGDTAMGALSRLIAKIMAKSYVAHKQQYIAPKSESEYAAFFERIYDLSTIEGIGAIPDFPQFDNKDMGVLSKIEYILQKKATFYDRNGFEDLAIACLSKATKIMPHSSIIWVENDYLRLSRILKKYGRFDEALYFEETIKGKVWNVGSLTRAAWRKDIENLKLLGCDLVYFNFTNVGVCSECAKWRRRVFSLSGKDKTFPKLTENVYETGKLHSNERGCYAECDCHYHLKEYNLRDEDCRKIFKNAKYAIESTLRPYKDDRTGEEMAIHEECAKKRLHEGVHVTEREHDRDVYWQLVNRHPEIMPRSFSAFRRMKNTQAKSYLKLLDSLREKGEDLLR